jgi:hypothetical protein
MELPTTRVFCAKRVNLQGPGPDGIVGPSSGKTKRTKRRMEAYPSDTEFFAEHLI